MSLTEQLFPEFQVVEDLAVEGDPQRRVLVAHGLLAAGEVNDAEPGMRQTHAVLRVKSGIVRPAMSQHPNHPLEGIRSDGRSIEIEYAGYATHNDSVLGAASAPEFRRRGALCKEAINQNATKTRAGYGHRCSDMADETAFPAHCVMMKAHSR
jgi:hypothetical protein